MTHHRFFSQLIQVDDCLEWPGAIDTRGYGHFRSGRQIVRAHRAAFESAFGAIPHGAHVLHKCDNRRCCNPEHLRLGTHAENMADMVSKGRSHKPSGESNGRALLSDADVSAIRADPRGTRTIAKDYPVSRSAIQRIKTGRAWVNG